MVALISFSRLYLGVHFPIDIAGGLMLGVGLTWLALAPSERWEAAGCPIPLSAAVGLCLAAWLAAVLSTDLAFAMLGGTLAAIVLTLRVRLSRLRFERPWQAPAAVAVGIVLLLAMSALLGTLPRSAEWVFASVTALWAVALVGYPLLLQRLLAAEEAVSVELG